MIYSLPIGKQQHFFDEAPFFLDIFSYLSDDSQDKFLKISPSPK